MPSCTAARSRSAELEEAARAPETFWRIVVVSGADLDLVERKLRHLYRTADGQPCQALLTTEYVQWKRLVLQKFASCEDGHTSLRAGAERGMRCRFSAPVASDSARAAGPQRALVAAIEAFMPGYHLLYVHGAVDISPYKPVTFESAASALGSTKRGREELETTAGGLAQ